MPFNNNFQKINQLLTDTYVGLTIEIGTNYFLNLTKTKNKTNQTLLQFLPLQILPLKFAKNDKCIKVKSMRVSDVIACKYET